MGRNITEQVPVGQLKPNTTFYMDDPSDPRVLPCYRIDLLDPSTPVWICYPDSRQPQPPVLPRGCWVVTREASYDERPVVIALKDDHDEAVTYAQHSGRLDCAEYMQFRVYRHGETVNWYDRSHCYQTGASDARLYEIRHGTRKPLPLGVGQLAATGLDVLGLGQPK